MSTEPPCPTGASEEESLPLAFGLLDHLLKSLTANPLTGAVGPEDLLRCLIENAHTPEVMEAMAPFKKIYELDQAAAAQVDGVEIDFAALPFERPEKSVWSLSIEKVNCTVDTAGRGVPEGTPGSQNKYLVCVNCMRVPRYYSTSVGLPDSETVLRTLKRGMARPFHLCSPALPRLLLIPFSMEHHVPTLKPFLDSLPAPFRYGVEGADLHEQLEAYSEMKAEAEYTQLMRLARKHKDAANVEFKARLREGAVEQYTAAIDCASRARDVARDDEEKAESRALLAVCYSNRAATHLLPGAGMDAWLARVDGEKAVLADALYVKGHIRIVRGYEADGDTPNAMKFLKRALDVPELSQESLLLQLLRELKSKVGDVVQ